MKLGDIWTVAGAGGYAGKPRPVVILQDDEFQASGSVTFCPFTTNETEAPFFRIPVEPDQHNGLRETCRLTADKITTVPRTKFGSSVGRLDRHSLLLLSRAVILYLNLSER